MQDDNEYGGVNKDLIGGIEDVGNSMMETMFNLSAYVSGSNNNEDNNFESDDDASSQLGVRNNHQNAASQGWTHLTGPNRPLVFISIDGVDNPLLDRARKEVPLVLLNLKKKIGPRRNRDARTMISPGDCLKAFMDPNFLGYMKAYINANMHTTDESLRPGRYTLITQRIENANIKFWSDEDPVLPYIETIPIMLTENKQTPEWFLLRKFWITGTDVHTLFGCY